VVEVAESLEFENLQARVLGFGPQIIPPSPIPLIRTPIGDYLGWFTLVAPPEMAGDSALVQVHFVDGVQPIHHVMLPLSIGGSDKP